MNEFNDILFTEKFRPTKIKHLILPKRIAEPFSRGIYQNFLAFGPRGTGKTSAAFALVKDNGNPYIYINVSDESSVDTIRNKIKRYASEADLLNRDKKLKVIILDEIDGASDQFYKALRGVIEKYSKRVRFVATCNYINKLPDAIVSRFETFNFSLSNEEEREVMPQFTKRVMGIFSKLDMKIEPSTAQYFVEREFPDFRSAINKIQGLWMRNIKEVTVEDIKKNSAVFADIYKMIMESNNPVENYKFLMSEYSTKVDEVLDSLGTDFIDWLVANEETYGNKTKEIAEIIPIVNDHQTDRNLVIDPSITMLSCVYKIQKIIHNE